ncbi:MAG: hypothetical protein AAF353_20145, partial [Pseudomonadota bacterium]
VDQNRKRRCLVGTFDRLTRLGSAGFISANPNVTGIDFEVRFEAAHEGDPAVLVADATLARAVLEWEPKFADLETIVDYAWQCELKNWPG